MAEITCPACGELNPAGSEECQSCHAELTTLVDSEARAGEQALPPGQDTQSEDPVSQETVSPGNEVENNPSGSGTPQTEDEPETPEWLRRIRIRHASEQSKGRTGLGNPEVPDWDAGDETEKGREGEGKRAPSGDFLDWADPGRQLSDTVPIVPGESMATEPEESPASSPGMEEEISPEQYLRAQPPSAFSYNLRITSTQHAHADLLDSIVHSEGLAAPVTRRVEAAPSPLLRWVVAVILLVSILWPILTEREVAPAPFLAEETGQVNNLIESLPEEASVLLAFDYSPGFSGELDAAAEGVVDHLVSRGAYLTLVSTLPAGPVLAERFLSGTINRHDLVRGIHYVNLGFVPGGPTGLLSLTENFQRALPYTLEGELAWNGAGESAGRSEFPPLEGIEVLSDFNLVLVLVDDTFTARSWIEQVQPALAEGSFQTPMAMVISAQIEPLVRPYYDAEPRQVQGFVTGLRGGTAYEQMTGRVLLTGYSWDAFIYGMSAAGLLLLAGWLTGVALNLFEQRGREQNGGRA